MEYCLIQRDFAQHRLNQWSQLLSHIETFQAKPRDHRHEFLVDMGESYHLQGRTFSNNEMYVNVGLNFLVPMDIHSTDIKNFVQAQMDYWSKRVAYWQRRAEKDKNVLLLLQYVSQQSQ